MCRRFATVRVKVTGASSDAGVDAAGQHFGLVRGGVAKHPTSPMGDWHVAAIAVELAEVNVGGPTDGPRPSVLTLGVEAL
jgi:hypothetical protein